MRLRLQIKKQLFDTGEDYFEYVEINITNFRWLPNHVFEYTTGSRWEKLKANEEIVGLGI